MHRRRSRFDQFRTFIFALATLGVLTTGCVDTGATASDPPQPTDDTGVVRTRFVVDNSVTAALGDELAGVRVEVASDTGVQDRKTVLLGEQDIQGFPATDVYFVLAPGEYAVRVTPLSRGGGVSRICGATSAFAVVAAGTTTEIEMLVICDADTGGGLDIIIGITRPPTIDDLMFGPSKFNETCSRTTIRVVASAGDAQLAYRWEIEDADEGFVLNETGPIAYFSSELARSYTAKVTVANDDQTTSLAFPLHITAGARDVCLDIDSDGDRWPDLVDNCPSVPNRGQQDEDHNGIGDACENMADLTILRVGVTPQPAVDGEGMQIHAVVANRGGTVAEPSLLLGCVEGDPSFCTEAADVPAIPAGEQVTVVAQVDAGSTQDRSNDQPYVFVLKVDAQDSIAEALEDNNSIRSLPFFVVTPFVPPSRVELDHDDLFQFVNGRIINAEHRPFPNGAPSDRFDPDPGEKGNHVEDPPANNPAPKIDPLLASEIANLQPTDPIKLVLLLKGLSGMPPLEELIPGENRYSPRNAPLLARRQAGFEGVRRDKLNRAAKLLTEILGSLVNDTVTNPRTPLRFIEILPLSGALLLEIPVAWIDRLADSDLVVRLHSINESGEYLDDGITTNDVIDARQQLSTDAYFNAGAEGGGFYFGVIDSGVRLSHNGFNSPDQVDFWRDCFNTTSTTCADTGDASWAPGDGVNHGTKVMGIVNSNANLGASWRGVADTTADSWDVTNASGNAPDCVAVERALNAAVLVADKVVTGSLTCGADETSLTSVAADAAFDAGTLVFFANGNGGPGASTVGAPAAAHKVMAIGAFDVITGNQYNNQSRGPTNDGRIKPDVQMPTNTETTSASSDNAQDTICCTSGATPYGAATALLLTDWFGNFLTSPGKIYAMLINYGANSFPFNNTSGAGPVTLGTGGTHISGSRTLNATGENAYVEFNVPAGAEDLRAAIWWPESQPAAHNDIDLTLERPAGTSVISSVMRNSVFEHAIVDEPQAGSWRLRIRAFNLPSPGQTVYYAVRWGP